MQHLARGTYDLVDRLDHVHWNTDGARLIGNRAGDGLPDPQRRIGREFIAAAIFKLIDRFHQANIAFLNEVEKLQTAIGVFLGNGNYETQIGLDHFLLGLTGFALALLHHLDDLAELENLKTRFCRQSVNLATQFAIVSFSLATKSFQPREPSFDTRSVHLGSSSEPM